MYNNNSDYVYRYSQFVPDVTNLLFKRQ